MSERRFTPDTEVLNDSLNNLRGIYATHAIEEARKNAEFLIDIHTNWESTLVAAGKELDIPYSSTDELPNLLEKYTTHKIQERNQHKAGTAKTVVGIAGPGAAGKGTLTEALGYPKVINTTTRKPRDYEQDGVHYHFVGEEEFKEIEDINGFVSVTERPGRGRYGVQATDLENVLGHSDTTLIEENPDTLKKLATNVTNDIPDADVVLTYILPPTPVALHLAVRLAGRCLVAGEDYRTAVESTLGTRQIDEFSSFIPLAKEGFNASFVVNDDPQRAADVIRKSVASTCR